MPLGKQSNLPGKGKRRVSAVDKDRFFVFPCGLHNRVNQWGVGGKSVKQRLHFDAGKAFVSQVVFQFGHCGIAEICVYPAQRNDLVGVCFVCRVYFFVEHICCRTEDGLFDVEGLHLGEQAAHIKIYVERTSEVSNMGVGIDFLMPGKFIHVWM